MSTITYEYGVRLEPDCIQHVDHQINLARRTYNEMIAAMRSVHDAAQSFQMEKAGPEGRAIAARIEALNTAFKEARAQQQEESLLQAIAVERRQCWRDLGIILKGVRQEHKKTLQEVFYNRIGINKGTDTYGIRCKAVADGLGWATAQDVLNRAIIAWKMSMKLGRAPQFARGDEKTQDALTVQFTEKGGMPKDKMLEGESAVIGVEQPENTGKRAYGHFWFRLGSASEGHYARGTIQWHRDLPEDASMASARLVRKRTGCKMKYYMQYVINTAQIRQVSDHARKALLAVHMGWSADISGRRVCGITDAADPELAQIIQLPPEIERNIQRAANIQGKRDQARDEIAPKIRAFDEPLPPEWDESTQDYWSHWKVLPANHMAASRIHAWRKRLGDFAPEWMAEWCKADRMLWIAATHTAQRARNRRKDFYRNLAKTWASQYEAIVIEKPDTKKAAKILDEATGERTEFAKKARAGRVLASLYTLDSAIRWACQKNGTAILDMNGEKTAATCAMCASEAIRADTEDGQVLHCADCGAVLDRKKNGAAVAWQLVNEQRENLVEEYWAEQLNKEREAAEAKASRLEKMQAARRAKREPALAE